MKTISILMITVATAGILSCSAKNEAKYAISGKNAPRDGAKVYLVDRLIADAIDRMPSWASSSRAPTGITPSSMTACL